MKFLVSFACFFGPFVFKVGCRDPFSGTNFCFCWFCVFWWRLAFVLLFVSAFRSRTCFETFFHVRFPFFCARFSIDASCDCVFGKFCGASMLRGRVQSRACVCVLSVQFACVCVCVGYFFVSCVRLRLCAVAVVFNCEWARLRALRLRSFVVCVRLRFCAFAFVSVFARLRLRAVAFASV